jgi:predicted glycoside hydrolase/deacetylase ChbG (UPF0249 family)
MLNVKFSSRLFILFYLISSVAVFAQKAEGAKLLIRCDDIGMCHSVNQACEKLIESKIPFSASVMVVCPWYQEAVELLKNHPEVTAGIHLTLNAEWKNFRWGPVAGKGAVPSLVDSCGFFFPSRSSLYAHNPKVDDIEKELRAQIDRAMLSGLKFYYVDYHMGTAVDKPEYRAIVEKLAKEYKLGISRYFGESDAKIIYSVPVSGKTDSLVENLKQLKPEKVNLLVCHIGLDAPEMQAMIDLNAFGMKEMSQHRQGELNALLSEKAMNYIESNKLKLITYGQLINEKGLESMKRPPEE